MARTPHRRAYGSGSVYQRADGAWRASVRYPDGTRRSVAAADRDDARSKLRQLLAADTAPASPRVTPPLTLAAYLAEWHQGLSQSDTKRTTVARYALDVRRWTERSGDTPLRDLSVPQVQRALADWRSGGLSASTVKHARAVLSAALHEAQRRRLLEVNVAQLARPPRATPPAHRALTVADARAILAAFADHPFCALVATALGTTLRQGELLALTWADVDLEAASVRVERRVYPLAGTYDTDAVKRSRQRGLVPLPAFAVAALRQHRQQQRAERLRAGKRWQDRDLVFPNRTGGTLSGPSVTHRFERQLAASGLPVITFHDLRRTGLTLLASLGVSLRVTQEIARHANVQTTAGVYALVTPEAHRQAAAILDRALREPESG